MENLTYFLEQYEPIRNNHQMIKSWTTDDFWKLCQYTLNLDHTIRDTRKFLRFGIYFYNGNYRERRTLFAPSSRYPYTLGIFFNNDNFQPIRSIAELSVFYQRFHRCCNNLQLKGVRKRLQQRNVLKNYLFFFSAHRTGLTPFFQVLKISPKQPNKVNWQQEGF